MHKGISRQTQAHFAIEVIGWYGVVAIIAAYFLLTLQYMEPDSLSYIVLNATGSAAIIIHSLVKKDYQPFFLNVVWLVIALLALLRAFA